MKPPPPKTHSPVHNLLARRRQLAQQLEDGVVALVFAGHEVVRNHDVMFPFRARSNFIYLAGFEEPGAVLVLDTRHGKPKWTAYLEERDEHMAVWLGERPSFAEMAKQHHLNEIKPTHAFEKDLPGLLAGADAVYHVPGEDADEDKRLMGAWARVRAAARRGAMPPLVLVDLSEMLGGMRLFKDETEIAALKKATAASAVGHGAARMAAEPGAKEYQVQAALEQGFRHAGALRLGYDPIVASGPNACVLHYVKNNRTLKKGDLLLIDAGGEVDGYTADITRTFCVGAAPSVQQKAILDIVLNAQQAAFDTARPGATLAAVHEAAQKELARGLIALKVLGGPLRSVLKNNALGPFYPHGTSHWLGLDVHDPCPYRDRDGQPITLAPGMVFTVEPGLYFRSAAAQAAPKFAGIGVRIEDDVLMTQKGHEILTAAVPKP